MERLKMEDREWQAFFRACAAILGKGAALAVLSDSWCSWTTFRRLQDEAGYWSAGLPGVEDIQAGNIADGGVWGQPFLYAEIAHIVIPRAFHWDRAVMNGSGSGTKFQDIDRLSQVLHELGIQHRLGESALEIKLY